MSQTLDLTEHPSWARPRPRSARPGPVDYARTLVAWTTFHAAPRLAAHRFAAKGDTLASFLADERTWRDPVEVYRRMHAAGPVVRGRGLVYSARHDVARRVLRGDDFGSMGWGGTKHSLVGAVLRSGVDPWALAPVESPSLLVIDGAQHARLRRLFSGAFTPRRLAGLEGLVRDSTEQLLDRLEERLATEGEADLVEVLASRLPVAVIAELLGVPESDHEQLISWGDDAAATLELGLSLRHFTHCRNVLRQMHLYMDDHLRAVAERLSQPGALDCQGGELDMISQLLLNAAAMPESERPHPHELRSLALLVLGAGFETTVNLIGNGVVQLTDHPDQLRVLQESPELWGNAIEEVLRYDPPVTFTGRIAKRDTELAGMRIGEELPVLLVLAAANRDPAVFTDPDRFDVARDNASDHLSFSSGPHFCLGAALARMEGRIVLEMLFERFPTLRVVSSTRRPLRVLRGHTKLRVRVDAP